MWFFAVTAVVLAAVDELVDRGLRRIPTGKYGSLNRILSGQVNADIVVNGSSRAAFHYDPRLLKEHTGLSAYNIGLIGARIDVQLGMLKAYLTHNTKPRVVIQNLETSIFTLTGKGEINDPGLFAPYLRDEELYRALVRADPVVWKWRHVPLYVYAVEDMRFVWARGLAGWLGRHGPETMYDGFNPNFERWGVDFFAFRAYARTGLLHSIDPGAVAVLEELIRVCRERGIELILVLSPEYHEAQALVRNRAEIFAEFNRLCAQYQVPFWDYNQSPFARQQDNFYSSQHLNADGATLFSADLARRLKAHLAGRTSP